MLLAAASDDRSLHLYGYECKVINLAPVAVGVEQALHSSVIDYYGDLVMVSPWLFAYQFATHFRVHKKPIESKSILGSR